MLQFIQQSGWKKVGSLYYCVLLQIFIIFLSDRRLFGIYETLSVVTFFFLCFIKLCEHVNIAVYCRVVLLVFFLNKNKKSNKKSPFSITLKTLTFKNN